MKKTINDLENSKMQNSRNVEIWNLLIQIKFILKSIIFVFFWMATIVTIYFCWCMVNNTNAIIDFLVDKPLYLEFMGNLILFPINVCFVCWMINICVVFYMRIIVSRMDASEIEKVGVGIRTSTKLKRN